MLTRTLDHLRLSGCELEQHLRLSGCELEQHLRLSGCELEQHLRLSGCELESVLLDLDQKSSTITFLMVTGVILQVNNRTNLYQDYI